MLRVSVSNLDKYAAYLGDDEFPIDRLLAELRGQIPRTPAMERGHAFAKAMENVKAAKVNTAKCDCPPYYAKEDAPMADFCPIHGLEEYKPSEMESSMLVAEGHAFAFTCNAEIEAWPRRELKAEKDYGGIIVSARCDRLHGNVIADDKTTSHFDADGCEKYTSKKQWRYYLDIFGAHEFVWHIWESREIPINTTEDYPGVKVAWEIFSHHVIRNYRYPEMENENREFALEYREFAARNGL